MNACATTALVVLLACGWGCHGLPPALEDYCPGDPMAPVCPGSTRCSGPYECVAYCLQHHPTREDVPESGSGSWCDDPALPPDYGPFCAEHMDVGGCPEYCRARPGSCEGPADGDSDVDGDVDGDADGDEDPDGSECVVSADCADSARPVCVSGVCHECGPEDESHCTGATPHCDTAGLRCVECLRPEHCDDGVACSADACDGFACVVDFDLDDDGADCTDDCDDTDPARFPGNREICDGIDNDCDEEPENDFALVVSNVLVSPVASDRQTGPVEIARVGDQLASAYCEGTLLPLLVLLNEDGTVVWRKEGPGASGCRGVAVAWNGTAIVAAWAEPAGVFAVAFDTASDVIAGPVTIDEAAAYDVALAADGSGGFALTWTRNTSSGHVVLLDSDLVPTTIVWETPCTSLPSIAAGPSSFLVGCSYRMTDPTVELPRTFLVDASGVGFPTYHTSSPDLDAVSVAWVETGYVVAIVDGAADLIRTRPLDAAGTATALEVAIVSGATVGMPNLIDAALASADPRGGARGLGLFFVAENATERRAYALRIRADGSTIGSPLQVLTLTCGDRGPGMIAGAPTSVGLAVVASNPQGHQVKLSTLETCF